MRDALVFGAGVVTGALGLFLVYLRYGRYRMPVVKPARLAGIVELQPWVKALMARGVDREEAYVESVEPRVTLRIRKRVYKTKANALVLEIRNVDHNQAHYDEVRSAVAESGIEFKERFTPRLGRPKDIRIVFEVDTLAPAAVAQMLAAIFDAAGVDMAQGLLVSDRDPIFWEKADS